MIYTYITLADETEILYSQVLEENGDKSFEIHFERVTEG
jgi:hypothetical protein